MMFQDTDGIKLALYDELKNILSPDHNTRTKAEERLSQLKVTGEVWRLKALKIF